MKALITGILGQDGPYLANFLLDKGYEVYGLAKKSNHVNLTNLKTLGIDKDVKVIQGDVTDALSVNNLIRQIKPNEVYNLAAQSAAAISWQLPGMTTQINSIGALNLLESIKNEFPECRYFQASSSDLFGHNEILPVTEKTTFAPENPYAISKLYAHWMTVNYRKSFGIHASNGILFNHESPLRSETFILNKIVHAAVRIKLKQQTTQMTISGIDIVRDWGYAPDFVQAMWMMLQRDISDDYLVCTGRPSSFKDLMLIAFESLDLNWEEHVRIDESLKRPTEVKIRYGDPTYTKRTLGWAANTSLETMINKMINFAMDKLK